MFLDFARKQVVGKRVKMGKDQKKRKYPQVMQEGDHIPIQAPNHKRNKIDPSAQEEAAVEEQVQGNDILTKARFKDYPLHDHLKSALDKLGYERLTKVQKKTLHILLQGKDLTVAAKTGSGKTLAFLLPAIEMLLAAKYTPRNGTGVIVITPTRELAIQIYSLVEGLMAGVTQTHGLIMGGNNRKEEIKKLEKGLNLIVSTPGRLLDHLTSCEGFVTKNLQCLVMDEADRILDIGFEEDLKKIVDILPKDRQTMLFSATLTESIENIIHLSMKEGHKHININSSDPLATVHGLKQGYCIVPSDVRFQLLFTFLKRNLKKKMIVFFSSCSSVKFHAELLNYIDIPVLELHGKMKQKKRTNTFFEFINASHGILLSTDVAARGLDIPKVDWIIQFDPPDDPKEYIHRVGRTARGVSNTGRALMFLLPEEKEFLNYLMEYNVVVEEYEFPSHKLAQIQDQYEKLLEKNFYLYKSARDAYRGYLLSYASHSNRTIFDVYKLDLLKVAKSFGFLVPPKVDLSFASLKTNPKKGNKPIKSGKPFSRSNPTGHRSKSDGRTFSR